MNIVALIGNVASEPILRTTASGRAVCTMRLAVNRPGSDAADFVTVVSWERQAEVVSQYVTTGRRVAVEGRLHHSTWSAEDGGPRSRVEIVASRVHLLSSPRSLERSAAAEQATDSASDTASESDTDLLTEAVDLDETAAVV